MPGYFGRMQAAMFEVKLEPMGAVFVADADQPIMKAARAAGVRLPRSCQNGTCRACLCHLRSGTVRYTIEWPGLSAEEKAEGCILPCVACASSNIVLLAPGAKPWP